MTYVEEPLLGGRLTDHVWLGVLSAAFSRDLIEEVVDVTGHTNLTALSPESQAHGHAAGATLIATMISQANF